MNHSPAKHEHKVAYHQHKNANEFLSNKAFWPRGVGKSENKGLGRNLCRTQKLTLETIYVFPNDTLSDLSIKPYITLLNQKK